MNRNKKQMKKKPSVVRELALMGLPVVQEKNHLLMQQSPRGGRLSPWVKRSSARARQPTPVFLAFENFMDEWAPGGYGSGSWKSQTTEADKSEAESAHFSAPVFEQTYVSVMGSREVTPGR